jgi:hypothetical protein
MVPCKSDLKQHQQWQPSLTQHPILTTYLLLTPSPLQTHCCINNLTRYRDREVNCPHFLLARLVRVRRSRWLWVAAWSRRITKTARCWCLKLPGLLGWRRIHRQDVAPKAQSPDRITELQVSRTPNVPLRQLTQPLTAVHTGVEGRWHSNTACRDGYQLDSSQVLQGYVLHESFRVWFEVVGVGSLPRGPISCPSTPLRGCTLIANFLDCSCLSIFLSELNMFHVPSWWLWCYCSSQYRCLVPLLLMFSLPTPEAGSSSLLGYTTTSLG